MDTDDDAIFPPDRLSPSPVFSRGTSSPLLGKRDVLLKTALTEEVAQAFREHAAGLGYLSISDALRDLIEVTLYGPEHLASLRQQQLGQWVGNRPGIGQTPDPKT